MRFCSNTPSGSGWTREPATPWKSSRDRGSTFSQNSAICRGVIGPGAVDLMAGAHPSSSTAMHVLMVVVTHELDMRHASAITIPVPGRIGLWHED